MVLLVAASPAAAIFRQRLAAQDTTSRSVDHAVAGSAAFVTPLLPDRFTEAQSLSKVKLPGWNASLHAGFFTIDNTTSSNTYFVFSEALSKKPDAPILLWLQGGPGASSLFGLFTEIGPFNIDEKLHVSPRTIVKDDGSVHHGWNEDYALLFLDNPLGTGFSFTDSLARMATNQSAPRRRGRRVPCGVARRGPLCTCDPPRVSLAPSLARSDGRRRPTQRSAAVLSALSRSARARLLRDGGELRREIRARVRLHDPHAQPGRACRRTHQSQGHLDR